jgi:opine dehydrogenase
MAMAADISLLGCETNIYEVPELADNLEPIRKNGGIILTGDTHSGKTGLAKFNKISDQAQEAIEGVELIMINTPAMHVGKFVENLAPFFVEGQILVVATGYWASLRTKELLRKAGTLDKVTFVEEHIMPYLSRKIDPTHAHIYNYKRDIRMSAWPATKNEAALKVVNRVYPQMNLSKNIIENNFYAGNPSCHAQIIIPKAEFFFERAKETRFYSEVSMCAAKLADAFDKERINVAAAFDCEVPMNSDWEAKTYLYKGKNMYEQYGNVSNPHTQRWTNDAGMRRSLIEDICYFFVPMEQLAELVGISVPVTKAMIEILQIFADFEYRANGITLKDLGLDGFTKNEIIDYVTYGDKR